MFPIWPQEALNFNIFTASLLKKSSPEIFHAPETAGNTLD